MRGQNSVRIRTRKVLAQQLDRRAHLLVADLFVLALLRVGLQTLPRQRAAVKVHEDETERFEIVAATLLCGKWQQITSRRKKERNTESQSERERQNIPNMTKEQNSCIESMDGG
jgi:hypothetical protein